MSLDEHDAKMLLNLTNSLLQALGNLQFEIMRNSGYLARQEIERLKEALNDQPHRLEHFGFKVYSQNDEDGILEEIFKRLGISNGSFCEIGVENGLECNTLYLVHKAWRGIWLEGNPNQEAPIKQKFHCLLDTHQLGLCIQRVQPDNINTLITDELNKINLNAENLDFLSIDIDGMDIYLLDALKIKPKVICIEHNSKFPPSVNRRPVYNPNYRWASTDYMGSSLLAIQESAEKIGYTLVGTHFCGTNAFLVRNDLVKNHFPGPHTAEALYNPPRYYLFVNEYRFNHGHPADFGDYQK
jgi:hypothetical protein